jgi:3-oxoacyl-[acyl-carrier protein] reductase
MSGLHGRVALITGASRGIGLAIAQRLVAEGARVCVTARNAEPLQLAVEELGGAGHAVAVAGKADDPAHQDAAVAATLAAYGRLDVLVNNTGINPVYGPVLSIDLAAVRKVFDVNVLAAIGWAQRTAEHVSAIVNVASVAGLRAAHGLGVYGASKAALIHLTQQLALELAPRVRVNAIAPALVKTRFATALYEGREEQVAARYPLGRLGVPADVGSVAAFLAGDDSAWMTGQTLVLDGGLTLSGGI